MNNTDNLYQLIHSLTPTEKVYFKRNNETDAKQQKLYSALFDALNEWPAPYDEAEFKRKHRNKAFVKNLIAHKHYLYEALLKSEIAFLRNNNVIIDFYTELQTLEILAEKKLYNPYTEKFEALIERLAKSENWLWRVQLHIRKNNTFPPITAEDVQKTYDIVNDLMGNVQKYIRGQYLVRMLEHLGNQIPPNIEAAKPLYEEVRQILDNEISLSNELSMHLIFASQIYLGSTNNPEALPFSLDIIRRFETEDIPEHKFVNFGSVIGNTLKIIAEHTKDPNADAELFFKLLNKLKSINYQRHNFMKKKTGLVTACAAEVNYLTLLNRYEDCEPVIDNFLEEIKSHEKHVSKLDYIRLYVNFVDVKIKLGKYDEAQEFIDFMLRLFISEKDISRELRTRIRVLLIAMLQSDIEKSDNALRALQRFMKKNEINDPFAIAFADLGKAYMKTASFKSLEVQRAYQQLQAVPAVNMDGYRVIRELCRDMCK